VAGNVPGIASVSTILRDAVHGTNPAGAANVNPITDGTPSASGGSSGGATGAAGTTASEIANDALRYVGHAYLYGGAPGTSGNSPWDCSSFVNWVVGHDNDLAIPGFGPGAYTGAVHGPPTGSWFIWGGCETVSRSDAQAGDIVVWITHMGIVTGPNSYISAHDPAERTSVTGIDGSIPGEPMRIRRLKATINQGQSPGQPQTGTQPKS
jgi:cell wall-associated NlpC family hydrolase